MPHPDLNSYDLSMLKDRVINVAFITFSLLAVLSHSVVIARAIEYGISWAFIIQTAILLLFITATILRKRLSSNIKIIIIFAAVLLGVSSGMLSYGILSSSTVYILAVPVFFSFIISLHNAIIFLLAYISMFGIFSILYSKGILAYDFDIGLFVNDSQLWLMEAIDIFLVSSGLLAVGYYFRSTLIKNNNQIRFQNKELSKHRDQLEVLVEERTAALKTRNDELQKANKKLEDSISEQKRTQAHLIESDKMASLGILTAGITHEINNPLNFIHGGYAGLEEYFEENAIDDETLKISLQSIKEGMDRATKIVSGLNQFSRSSGNKSEQCNIHDIIDNCLMMLNNKIKYTINVNKQYTDEEFVILGNEGKLHQVFLNILNNACQAIEGKGSISIVTRTDSNYLNITIADSGKGISPESLPQITHPFFTTKKSGEGTGLGLSISSKILCDHGSTLDFISEVNKGTQVLITMPLS
jgi:signal transduction histidine kinase